MAATNKKLAVIAALFVVAVSVVIAYSTFINYAPHFFSANECLECHFTIPQAGDEGPMRFNKPISVLCGGCHKGMDVLSHVVDVVPSMKMPDGMPLDSLGMMTCATCHDPYSKGGGAGLVIGEKDSYQDLCLGCHKL